MVFHEPSLVSADPGTFFPMDRGDVGGNRNWVDVNKNTVVDWFNCRDLCSMYMDEHNEKIGGVGKVVEIDEAKSGKQKYNHGRYVDQTKYLCKLFPPMMQQNYFLQY